MLQVHEISFLLADAISHCDNIDKTGNSITLRFNDLEISLKYQAVFKSKSIQFESLQDSEISIELNNISEDYKYYLDVESCAKVVHAIIDQKEWKFIKNFSILNFEGLGFLDYSHSNNTIYINGIECETYFVHFNCIAFYKFISLIKNPSLCDYFNTQNNEAVYYLSTKGISRIRVPGYPKNILFERNLLNDVDKLNTAIEAKDFGIHFKNQLYNQSIEKNDFFDFAFANLSTLLTNAENDYQLFIKNFSFDKFKSDLQKEKEKYFTSLREILNKLSSQVISIPLAISASVFATYKLDKDKYTLMFIGVAFIIYTVFTLITLWYYSRDNKELKAEIKEDEQRLIVESGIGEIAVKNEFKKIKLRTGRVTIYIWCFFGCIILLSLLFILYLYFQINATPHSTPSGNFRFL